MNNTKLFLKDLCELLIVAMEAIGLLIATIASVASLQGV